MKIAGIQKLTLLDYPGHTACTVFLPGCNMRCGYCHNKELVIPDCIAQIKKSFISEEAFFNFLHNRQGLLDGVCITGGEPTMHIALPRFISQIKEAGFKVKLDTNGTNFHMLKELIDSQLIDYVAMDIKASLERYSELTHLKIPIEDIKKSKDYILESAVPHEFRTTVIKEHHDQNEFNKILKLIAGANRYFIQNFRSKAGCIDQKFESYQGFSQCELKKMKNKAANLVGQCGIRE